MLFHTYVRWLSKGNMLIRPARLLPEVIDFLKTQHKQELKSDISDVVSKQISILTRHIFSFEKN